jgi:uncharacterized SAM-binding protein YcdF (DUF218 family)
VRRRALPAAGLVLAAWLVATAVLFLWPPEDKPRRADAVVVLSGGRKHRLREGLRLMRADVAPRLVISDGRARGWKQANRLCAGHASFQVICFKPDPYSTQGEAEDAARMAERNGWRSLVVVTSTFHVTRARMLFRRCFRGRVAAVGARSSLLYLPGNILMEWGKLLYQVTVDRDC